MRWLAELPMAVVGRYARMMRRMRAEEALAMIETLAVGTGAATEAQQRQVQTAHQRHRGVHAPKPTKFDPNVARAAGIGVTLVGKAQA